MTFIACLPRPLLLELQLVVEGREHVASHPVLVGQDKVLLRRMLMASSMLALLKLSHV